jgi:hypothetical protein
MIHLIIRWQLLKPHFFCFSDFYYPIFQAGLSEEVAKNYTEIGKALRTGEMNEDYMKNKPALGKIKRTNFASEFAAGFHA